ncbi:hypothetical protein GXM_04139 [Nostoc sphaeroides CCNUC1]|uniref:Uncharacterized protein n=1 Tax=Nostoc sphaeroides CCNUC1 TaxID=2653204 RepID=A0A5P8W1Q6_9NOSO|nr:hypothetical protein GXM_04139 [Nostoc sphaeroides CCNUC1]
MLQYITHVYVSKNFSNILLSQNDTILEMSICHWSFVTQKD